MKDVDKIHALRSLLSTVSEGSKPKAKPDLPKERRKVKDILAMILGREPKDDEVSLAATF